MIFSSALANSRGSTDAGCTERALRSLFCNSVLAADSERTCCCNVATTCLSSTKSAEGAGGEAATGAAAGIGGEDLPNVFNWSLRYCSRYVTKSEFQPGLAWWNFTS